MPYNKSNNWKKGKWAANKNADEGKWGVDKDWGVDADEEEKESAQEEEMKMLTNNSSSASSSWKRREDSEAEQIVKLTKIKASDDIKKLQKRMDDNDDWHWKMEETFFNQIATMLIKISASINTFLILYVMSTLLNVILFYMLLRKL